MVIPERFYQVLDKNGEAQAVAFNISKAFDRIWHAGLLHKLKIIVFLNKFSNSLNLSYQIAK